LPLLTQREILLDLIERRHDLCGLGHVGCGRPHQNGTSDVSTGPCAGASSDGTSLTGVLPSSRPVTYVLK
jgi:hypothetical protein